MSAGSSGLKTCSVRLATSFRAGKRGCSAFEIFVELLPVSAFNIVGLCCGWVSWRSMPQISSAAHWVCAVAATVTVALCLLGFLSDLFIVVSGNTGGSWALRPWSRRTSARSDSPALLLASNRALVKRADRHRCCGTRRLRVGFGGVLAGSPGQPAQISLAVRFWSAGLSRRAACTRRHARQLFSTNHNLTGRTTGALGVVATTNMESEEYESLFIRLRPPQSGLFPRFAVGDP